MKTASSKKKIVLPVIAIVLLITLIWGVFYSFTFIRSVLNGVTESGGGAQAGVTKFELQKAIDIGVVPE